MTMKMMVTIAPIHPSDFIIMFRLNAKPIQQAAIALATDAADPASTKVAIPMMQNNKRKCVGQLSTATLNPTAGIWFSFTAEKIMP